MDHKRQFSDTCSRRESTQHTLLACCGVETAGETQHFEVVQEKGQSEHSFIKPQRSERCIAASYTHRQSPEGRKVYRKRCQNFFAFF